MLGAGTIVFNNCRTGTQTNPFVVNSGGARVTFIEPRTNSTPSANSIIISSALSAVMVGEGVLDKLISGTLGTYGLYGVSADRGDNSITFTWGTDVPVQRFPTALTANPPVTFAGVAWNGRNRALS